MMIDVIEKNGGSVHNNKIRGILNQKLTDDRPGIDELRQAIAHLINVEGMTFYQKPQRVLIDLDGVLVDFFGRALSFFGHGDFDINTLNGRHIIHDILELSDSEFWTAVDRKADKFWSGMKKLPDADDLVHYAEVLTGDIKNVAICSSPSRNPMSAAHKLEWVEQNYPALKRQVILTPVKYFCSSPGTLLIDDWEKNSSFADYGGDFFLIPRPWNSRFLESESALNLLQMEYPCETEL